MDAKSTQKKKISLRELLIGLGLLVVASLLALPLVRNTMTMRTSHSCQDNLRQWGTIFFMYRAENNSYNPLTHGYESFGAAENALGCTNIDDEFDFAPEVSAIFPEYADNTAILACPEANGLIPEKAYGPIVVSTSSLDPDLFAIAQGSCSASGRITRPGAQYTYFGYEVKHADDADLQVSESQALLAGLPAIGPANIVAILEHFQVDDDTSVIQAQNRRGTAFDRGIYMDKLGFPYAGQDLSVSLLGPLNSVAQAPNPAAQIIAGIDNTVVAAGFPTMVVMWDALRQNNLGEPIFNHVAAAGCNVLFMDGHVEFKAYPGVFPVSTAYALMRAVP